MSTRWALKSTVKRNRPASRRGGAGVLLSGGLDSFALIAHALKRKRLVWPVFVRCGFRWEHEELRSIKRFLARVRGPELTPLTVLALPLQKGTVAPWATGGRPPGARSEDRAVFLPGRNLMLAASAALALRPFGVREVMLGTLKGNPFHDATPAYFRQLSALLSRSLDVRFRVSAPFRSWTKAEVIRRYGDWPIHLSVSCLTPSKGRHCGRCNKCSERKKAFREAGVTDRTVYVSRRG
jgi:7-cyano-7-deazaguanine synthase